MNRRAFTLIEMLVVITILLIVSALTITLINVSAKHDRIREGARTIQSYFEGARDRAIFMRKPVGVRLLVDEDPATVSGLVWVVATDPWKRGTLEVRREDSIDNVTMANGADGLADPGAEATILLQKDPSNPSETPDDWWRLKRQGLLTEGMQVRLQGNWYSVSTANLTATNPNRLDLVTPYTAGTAHPAVLAATFVEADNHELTLAPSVMPNQEPNRLPTGIKISRLESQLPQAWQYPIWQASTAYLAGDVVYPSPFKGVVFQSQADGTSGSGTPSWPDTAGVAFTEGGVDWYSYPAPHLDVLFSPRGTVTGSIASEGVLHFALVDQADLDLGRWLGHPEKEHDELICTLFTMSGHISSHPVDTTDGDADDVPDDPFFFAETGEVAR